MKRIYLALAASLIAGAASAQGTQPANVVETAKGKALADGKGMTFYTFDRDTAGASDCTGQCAQNWPPLAAAGDAKASGDRTVIIRQDGNQARGL
jgi:predicted lipoprotein with Yx(FWY)xxD motif